ncbi:MAG: flagellar biosynthetic protein FliR [Planctomycetota bacterium]|jgi:flagellar biosynthesis protein FliR|nr:flagellar biosynthetic protein FliR [Planctomycetota bacterium]
MSGEMLEVNRILVAFIVFGLILVRCGCIVLFSPFFASELFPGLLRIFFIGGFSLLMIPTAARTAEIPRYLDLIQIGILVMQEFTLGMAIGFLASLVFSGIQLAGEIAGQQIGFSMANVVDPLTNVDVPLLGFMNMNIAMLLFIMGNLHLVIIYIVGKSYEFVGIGTMMPEVVLDPLLRMTLIEAQRIFSLGLQLAIPISLVMLLNSVVEGFITKTMPQMHIMVLGVPLRVVLGLTSLIFIYPIICYALMPPGWRLDLEQMPEGAFGDMLQNLSLMVSEWGGP